MSLSTTTKRTGLLVGVAAVGSLVVLALAVRAWAPLASAPRPAFTVLLQAKLFFSTFTVLLLVMLLINYARIYRALPNRFTLALGLFTVLLGFHAVTSNPLVPLLFGFRVADVGPFTYLPGLFTSAAVVVLLRQSLQ